jgi:glycosyltransferase involved in cell wall biosynthesis
MGWFLSDGYNFPFDGISVVIPARNEAMRIGRTVATVLEQGLRLGIALEAIVVDDGSTDETTEIARRAGARVLALPGSSGNPGRARNHGARAATGDLLVFLDADCVPRDGWLAALLRAHATGAGLVGGAIDAPPGQALSARCDHYCASYHVHPGRARAEVRNHPPANLSVRRHLFLETNGFEERHPAADGHEELIWQAALARLGHRITFEPAAVVCHHNRGGWLYLLRRNYRWAYSAIRSKAQSPSVRWQWLYKHPAALLAAAPALALAHAAYTVWCWTRAGVREPLALLPAVVAARTAYAAGLAVGGLRWFIEPEAETRPLGGR